MWWSDVQMGNFLALRSVADKEQSPAEVSEADEKRFRRPPHSSFFGLATPRKD